VQPSKIQVEVAHVCGLQRPPHRRAVSEVVAQEVGPAIAKPEAHPLSGAHASQHDLRAIGALAGIEPLLQASCDKPVDDVDQSVLALGPEHGELLGALGRDDVGSGLGDSGVLRGRRRCQPQTGNERSHEEERSIHDVTYEMRPLGLVAVTGIA
jgi:hypothetical protein